MVTHQTGQGRKGTSVLPLAMLIKTGKKQLSGIFHGVSADTERGWGGGGEKKNRSPVDPGRVFSAFSPSGHLSRLP